jgi:tetratricopeptide (TPR) repeat protein
MRDDADADRWYTAAQRHATEGEIDDAIQAYSTAIALAPTHVKARIGRATAFQRVGEHVHAINDFDSLIHRYSEWSGIFAAFYGRAVSLQAVGSPGDAVAACDESLKRDPDFVDAIYLRGVCWKDLGRFDAATNDMDAVILADPTYLEAYIVRGGLHSLRGLWTDSRNDFTAAIQQFRHGDPSAHVCFFRRGVAAQNLGDHRAALADFTRAIEMAPGCALQYFRRSFSYRELGEQDLADADFRLARGLLERNYKEPPVGMSSIT